jgi:hypothetical protein
MRTRTTMTHMAVVISDGASLTDGGHDLDNYLFPLAQRLGPPRLAAIFGSNLHGRRH